MIRKADTKRLAGELHSRYEPMRAVVLMSRLLQKALFAGRSDEVIFWALVHAHYRGGDLSDASHRHLAAFSDYILPDPSEFH
ncbi:MULTISPECIES: hypothetical protein [unclassified Bradyrhizobium]|uniref:hypothetical protein n=1 Tax=unclassified Bradyrhizobium TaxID=2631580 RepID=UPI0020B26D60|nr:MULTISPECIES: hypothetical protein [unclassified Bradyrhizobium]MCP3468562.1 hypothetical protein [Bradyrhizobium sp. CCGUVB23]MCP3477898.1 hypothetical protein [Bradyrhizobium sp. CCGUVB1N3]